MRKIKIPIKLITNRLNKGEYWILERIMKRFDAHLESVFSDRCPYCNKKNTNGKVKKITYLVTLIEDKEGYKLFNGSNYVCKK